MANQIFVNADAVTLGDGVCLNLNDLRRKSVKNFGIGDAPVFEIFLTGQRGAQDIQTQFSTFKLGVGTPGASTFTTGDVTITGSGGGTTITNANLDSASTWQSTIATETAANTTTALDTYKFHVKFTANGARTLPTVTNTIDPASSVSIVRLVTGTASVKEQWLVQVFNNPIALQTSHNPITRTFNGASVNGIEMTLGLQTAELVKALGSSSSLTTTLEFEATDTNTNQITLFQVPFTVTTETIGSGTGATATYSNFLVASDLDSFRQRANTVFVSDSRGNDTTGTADKRNKPFATITAAIAAAGSGDAMVIEDGVFTSSANIIVNKPLFVELYPKVEIPGLSATQGLLDLRGPGKVNGSVLASTGAGTGDLFLRDVQVESVQINTAAETYIEDTKIIGQTVLASGASPVVVTSGSSAGGTCVFKNCRISERNQNSLVNFDDSVGSFAFDGCTFETQSSSNAYIFEYENANRSPLVYVKDCVMIGTRSDAKLFKKTNAALDPIIRFVGGLTTMNIETDPFDGGQSEYTVSGNFNQDSNVTSYPFI